MKLEVEQDAFAGALKSVIDAVDRRNTIPVLSNVLLRSDGERLSIHATDLDMQVTAEIDAEGAIDTTVPAAKLQAVVSSLKGGVLKIEAGDGKLVLKQGGSRRALPTLPSSDFPLKAPIADALAFRMPAFQLHRLLDRCHVAMSNEETRYYINGVFLHVVGGAMRSAATDGHRLIRAEVPLPDGAAAMNDIIVPRKVVLWLRAALAKREGDIDVAVSAGSIAVTIGARRLHAKLIDGTFPDYARVIPSGDLATRMTLPCAVLEQAAGCVAAVIDAEGEKIRTKCVRFDLTTTGKHQAYGRDQAGAEVIEEFDGELVGAGVIVGVNAAYLGGVLSQFSDGAAVTFEIDGASSPARIISDKDPDMIAVVMPMRV